MENSKIRHLLGMILVMISVIVISTATSFWFGGGDCVLTGGHVVKGSRLPYTNVRDDVYYCIDQGKITGVYF